MSVCFTLTLVSILSFHSSPVASSFSSTCLFSSRGRLFSFIWGDVSIGSLSDIPWQTGMRTRLLFWKLWRKERKGCINFCGFIELSHDCILFGLCFFLSFQFVIAPSNFYLKLSPVCGNSSESFCNPFVQDYFCFQTAERVHHCDIKRGQPRVLLTNQMKACAVVSSLIGSAGSWKIYDSEAERRGCEVIRFYKTVLQLKERNFNRCSCLPSLRFYPRGE